MTALYETIGLNTLGSHSKSREFLDRVDNALALGRWPCSGRSVGTWTHIEKLRYLGTLP